MSCGYSEERLAMWMDSSEADLPVAEIREVNQHLASCAPCRETMARLRESQAFARSLRVDAVNAAVLSQVHQRVMDQVADLRRPPSWIIQLERSLFSGMRRKYVLAGFGSLVLVCGVALGLMWVLNRRLDTTVPVPPVEASFVAAVSEPLTVISPAGNAPQRNVVRRVKRTPKTETVAPDSSTPAEHPPKIMVKLFTDDPSVVIYWTLDGNGESQ